MGRRKLEIKRIEDKSRRLVTFSKRRAGLFKKARQLSVLCNVDAAVAVFSAGGKLYEFCSSGTNSVRRILFGYQQDCLEVEEAAINGAGEDLCIRRRTCKELLRMVDRLVGQTNNSEEYSVTDMMQLEEELSVALLQIRSRKAHLMMKYISTLQEEERKSTQEKEESKQQVASANQRDTVGGGGLYVFENNQNRTNSAQKLLTLSLFNE